MKRRWIVIGPCLLLLLAACNVRGTGSDALTARTSPTAGPPPACEDCHAPGSSYDPIALGGTGTAGKHTAHVQQWGVPCETCHSGYYGTPRHIDAAWDTDDPAAALVSFDALNPTGAWSGDVGAGTGSCADTACHGAPAVEWYAAAGSVPPVPCTICHGGLSIPRRTIAGADGDFGANLARVSHHVLGSADPTEAQCRVCHEQSLHTGGTVRLRHADTDTPIAYDPANPSTLEPFCLSCHDAGVAGGAMLTFAAGGSPLQPFADGGVLGTAPFGEGVRIASYWTGAYNRHKVWGLTCTSCHGSGGTPNAHGAGFQGLLTKSLSLPVTTTTDFDYEDYRLCFDCHDGYPSVSKEVVLGYKEGGNYHVFWAPTPYYTAGIQSLFRDRYISNPANYPAYWLGVNQTYNDTIWSDPYVPLHNWHLSRDGFFGFVAGPGWTYRTGAVGRLSCVTCHNVHGTVTTTVRSVYAEFGITIATGLGGDEYGIMANWGDATLKSAPINCAVSCHDIAGPVEYWYAPSDE